MIGNIVIFILGLATGSFLNVCIYRMPREQSVRKPSRSFCPNCKKTIRWYDNIPILSFVFLKRRCRFCREKISWRYPIVELLSGLLFLATFNCFGATWYLPIYLVFIAGLIGASFIDIEHQIIPDEISLGGLVLGLIVSFAYPQLHNTHLHLVGLLRSFIGVLVGGGIIYITGALGTFAFKKEAMGGGDVKLLAMMGAFLGWQAAVIIFFAAPFLACIISIVINVRKVMVDLSKKENSTIKGSIFMKIKVILKILVTGTIPYGPFLVIAALAVLFYRDIINILIRNYLLMCRYQ